VTVEHLDCRRLHFWSVQTFFRVEILTILIWK